MVMATRLITVHSRKFGLVTCCSDCAFSPHACSLCSSVRILATDKLSLGGMRSKVRSRPQAVLISGPLLDKAFDLLRLQEMLDLQRASCFAPCREEPAFEASSFR